MAEEIKHILAAVRNYKGLTQQEVSKRLNTALTTYQSYERGVAVPPLKVLAALSDIYGLSVDQLSGRSSIKKGDMAGIKLPANGTDLKAFTMAAMKGYLSAGWWNNIDQHEDLAKHAVSAARATLNELSKHR